MKRYSTIVIAYQRFTSAWSKYCMPSRSENPYYRAFKCKKVDNWWWWCEGGGRGEEEEGVIYHVPI